jgi:hypothetical protein
MSKSAKDYSCNCGCHSGQLGAKHVTACCSSCSYCGARVRQGHMEEHWTDCWGKRTRENVADRKGRL